MALFGLLGGGDGKDDDPYADILTPGQRNQMLTQGLLAMAGAFADAGMPSRLPIPFGSALGKAAAALGTGQEAGMTAALAGALKAQQIRDLRAKAALQAKLNPLFQQVLDQARGGGGATPPTLPLPGPGARPGPSRLSGPGAPAAADAPLMYPGDLPYPATAGGGLLGDDIGAAGEYGGGQRVAGLLGPDIGAAGEYGAGQPAARGSVPRRAILPPGLRVTNEGTSGGSGGGPPAAEDPGAGGDGESVWGPTFPQTAAASSAPAWAADPLSRGLRGDQTGQNAMAQFRNMVFGAGDDVSPVWGPTFPQASRTSATGGDPRGKIPVIQEAAVRYGVDPDVAVRVARSEGLGTFYGDGGKSGTAFQIYTGGGLGNTFQKETGLNPLDPKNEDAAIDWAMRNVSSTGWGPYHGAKLVGVGNRTGLPGSTTEGSGGSTEPDPYANLTPRSAGGAPLAAPSTLPGLAAPGTLPPLAAPGSIGAPGSGSKIPGLNMSPQELAVIDAMAEAAGLGNPFKGLLETYYKSPGYLQESAGATAKGREAVEFPNRQQLQNEKARSDLLQQMAKDALTLDEKGNVVEIPGMRGMLGKTAEEIEAGKERAKAQFAPVEAPVLGPNGQPTTEKMTAYEFSYRRQQRAANAALGAPPQPGDIIGMPALTGSPPEGYRYNVSPQGTVTAQPIPGTPAEETVKERNRKQAVSDQATLVSRDIMVQNANRVEDLVANSALPVTGTAGPFLSRIGGTAANDVRVMIETMKARSSLDQLNQMRNSNPTGAGLGNVSNAEGDRLAAAIANLDQSQTQDQFLFNLRRLKQEYVDIVHGPGTYSKLSDEPALKVPSMPSGNQPIDRATYDKLPSGSPFTAPDGSRRIKP